jgi:hypothetical protein
MTTYTIIEYARAHKQWLLADQPSVLAIELNSEEHVNQVYE